VSALQQLLKRCAKNGTRVIFSGLQLQPREIIARMGLRADGKQLQFAENFAAAVLLATNP
jgi:SulP family sulfate permease